MVSERAIDHAVADDQSDVIQYLSSPEAHGGARVERIDTHASVLFLAADRAWKLKRAVRYDYLDYSTAERRRSMCEREFILGRPLAPAIYRRVVSINRDPQGRLGIDGPGAPVDWLIEMTRFDQARLFDRMATRHGLDVASMPALAHVVSRLHETAERRFDHGGHAGMAWVIEGNAAGFLEDSTGALDRALAAQVTAASREMADRFRARLDARRDAGHVRRCHGDLHLGNIVEVEGRPTPFDPVEFNDAISCIDVMYDLAFLLMDLERLSLREPANVLLNTYVSDTMDVGGLAVLPLFLGCRAAVRAKTRATSAALQVGPAIRASDEEAAAAYLDLARRLLHPPAACVVAIGGCSGTGKSSLARRLAPHLGPTPGAIIARSDALRKRMFGVSSLVRLDASAYTTPVSDRVYDALAGLAGSVAASGHAAAVDAVFLEPAHRRAIENVAQAAGLPFVGLWLTAPEPVLLGRVTSRGADVSDATAEVVRAQVRQDTGPVSWHQLDAARHVDQVLDEARRVVAAALERSHTDKLIGGPL
jgi:aminoglycoside phosphotransferase family enzyme/predicted kinase